MEDKYQYIKLNAVNAASVNVGRNRENKKFQGIYFSE